MTQPPGWPGSQQSGQPADTGPWGVRSPWQQERGPSFDGPATNWPEPSGRPPTQPFGEAPPPHTRIVQFTSPKSRLPLIVSIAVLTVLALVVGIGLFWHPEPPLATTMPPTASAASARPSRDPYTIEFTGADEGSAGTWSLLDQRWDGDKLTVKVKVSCVKGPMSYGFYVFETSTSSIIEPTTGGPSPELTTGNIDPGSSAEGYVTFQMTRGAGMVILTTADRRQVSALAIKA